MSQNLTDLKKQVFFGLLDMAGRVFIHVRYSDAVLIGDRGFLAEEKEKGLVLVFNAKMKFEWNEQGIEATLGFGPKTEKCFVPPENIISVFSPDLNAQFSISPAAAQEVGQKKQVEKKAHSIAKQKVIKVDFSRKS